MIHLYANSSRLSIVPRTRKTHVAFEAKYVPKKVNPYFSRYLEGNLRERTVIIAIITLRWNISPDRWCPLVIFFLFFPCVPPLFTAFHVSAHIFSSISLSPRNERGGRTSWTRSNNTFWQKRGAVLSSVSYTTDITQKAINSSGVFTVFYLLKSFALKPEMISNNQKQTKSSNFDQLRIEVWSIES